MKWLALSIGLALTLGAWYWLDTEDDSRAQERFDILVADAAAAVRDRLDTYAQALNGGAGLFAVSPALSRSAWRTYVENLRIENRYPGIQGIGFAKHVPPGELDRHLRQLRDEGFPAYRILPSGARAEYTPVIYLEPFSGRNLRAFGYDMFSEPARRAAMERARDRGRVVISAKVTLVQETERDVQAGFLMYMPVYRGDMPSDTPVQRRAALAGYVYSTFRMNDFVHGVISLRIAGLGIEIFDGEGTGDEARMFSTGNLQPRPRFSRIEKLDVHGHGWTMRFTSPPNFEAESATYRPAIVLASGVLISLLFFAMTGLQQAVERNIRQSEERFRIAVDAAPNAMIMMGRDGRLTLANVEAERMFGYTKEELVGMEVERLVPQGFRGAHPGHRTKFFADPQPRAMGAGRDLYGLRKDGAEVPIEIGLNPVTTQQGVFVLASIIDITGRKQSEDEIRRVNDELAKNAGQLEVANKELASFNYSVSHDLRAPLRAVAGFTRILEKDYGAKLDDEGRRLIQVIRDGSRTMDRLILDLLEFSRLRRAELAAAPVDMTALAREALRNLAPGGIAVECVVKPMPPAWGDRVLLRQVCANLLDNALKYSSRAEKPRIEVGGSGGEAETCYYVRDNGAGFDMRYYDKLFGVFQRLHNAEQFPGTGVGLAIVQRIVTRHGGRVWAEGKVNEGATFHFALPRGGEHGGLRSG